MFVIRSSFVALIISLCLSFHTNGQEMKCQYAYRLFTSKDGLPGNQVTSLLQDRDGYIWIGTKGGLSCYDGVKFKNYTSRNGVLGGINNIMQASTGEIIVYTNNGVQIIYEGKISPLYTDTNYSYYLTNACLINDKVFARVGIVNPLLRNKYGQGSAIVSFDIITRKFSTVGFIENHIDEIMYVSANKALLFSTDSTSTNFFYTVISENGLSLKHRLPFSFYYASRKLSFNHSLVADKSGNVYKVELANDSCHFEEVIQLKSRLTVRFPFLFKASSSDVYYVDKNNDLLRSMGADSEWIANIAIPHTALLDKEDNFWFATEDGLYCFYDFSFKEYHLSLPNKNSIPVWSMAQTRDSILWFGSYTEGLFRYEPNKNRVNRILVDNKGKSEKAVSLHFHPVVKNDTLYYPAHNYYLVITKDRVIRENDENRANLYFYNDSFTHAILAGEHNIRYLDSNLTFKSYVSNKGLGIGLSFVLCMCRDQRKNIWFASSKKVGYVDTHKKVHDFPIDNNSSFYSVLCDHRGNLWFAGNNGLWHYDFQTLRQVDSLRLHSIGALYEYRNRHLIISCVGKLAVLNLDSFYTGNEAANIYSSNTGFNGLDFSQNSIMEDNEGFVWINSTNALIRFHPDSLSLNVISKPKLKTVEISSDNVHWTNVDDTVKIVCPTNSVRFTFATITNNYSEDIYYRYRLKGFSDWSLPTTNSEATYTNLSPDNYLFEIMSSKDGIHWSECTYSYPIYISPIWYQTRLFYILLVLFSVLGSAFVTLLFIRRKRKTLEAERKLIGLQLQSVRNRMLPHLTNNVYTNIIYLIKNDKSSLAVEYTYILSRLNNKILSLSERKSQPLSEELKFVEEYLQLQKLIYKEKFHYKITIDENIDFSVEVPILALHTFSENALKHGLLNKNGGGTISIKGIAQNDGILLSVIDDGVGRKTASKYNTDSTKQGLTILFELIRLFNKGNRRKVIIEFIDLIGDNGNGIGTVSQIYIPHRYKY